MTEKTGKDASPLLIRRSFLNYCIGASSLAFFGFVGYMVARYMFPPSVLSAETEAGATRLALAELPVGSAKVVRYKGEPAIVVRMGERSIRALSAVCTHLGCIVKWDGAKNMLVCPCHAAFFDLNGNVVGGPAPRPLTSFPIKIAGEEILIGEA
ncbi:MAG: Rieske (2Fe-2S) protein [Candidatus Abyssubacteria bacterium]